MANNCWLWRLGGAGVARSLLPGDLAPKFDACVAVVYPQRHIISTVSAPLPHTPPKAQTGCSVCVGDFCCAFMLSTMVGVGNATGAAMRRRQRRLRAWARHERLSIAMAPATVEHHSYGPTANAAPSGQTTGTSAREGEVRELHYGLRAQKRPLPGLRPAPLSEVLPQVGLQRHTVQQRIVHTPYVQILDAPVPQKVEQLVDFFKNLDIEVPAQVIEVPKIS